MRISYNWLRELVPFEWSPEELGERLTGAGFEVEAIEACPEGIADLSLEVEVTPNRGDVLSAIGLAREIAALAGQGLHLPPLQVREAGGALQAAIRIEIADPDLSPRYSARLVRGVRVGESPRWLQERLLACGMRPINNIVDITNYVLLERGQPLHAFDFDLLKGPAIIVRRARPGEVLVTLDGEKRELQPDHLVIADAERAVALAGIMGGANTEVTFRTRNVLIESAHFSKANIRRTARALGMRTEASYRFERRVDPGGTLQAADRAAQLMAELAGGEVVAGVADVYPHPEPAVRVYLRTARCNLLLGTALTTAEVAELLRRLSLPVEVEEGGVWVDIPSYRGDLRLEADLVEEVARIYGYNRIPETLPQGVAQGQVTEEERLERQVRAVMRSLGLSEAVNFSLTGTSEIERAGLSADGALRVRNALSEEYCLLRPSMIPTILSLVGRNYSHAHRVQDIWVFELGKVYRELRTTMRNDDVFRARATGQPSPQPAIEERHVAGALLGTNWTSLWNWRPQERAADFYTAKGVVEALARELRVEAAFRPAQHPTFHPGRCAEVVVDGEPAGVVGEVRREIATRYDVPERIYLFDVNLDGLLEHAQPAKRYQPLPRFPIACRDIAFVVDRSIPAVEIEAVIRRHGGEWLQQADLFDVYTGAPIPEGQRSLAYHLLFRHPERTLTDEEVDQAIASLRSGLESQFQVRWREM